MEQHQQLIQQLMHFLVRLPVTQNAEDEGGGEAAGERGPAVGGEGGEAVQAEEGADGVCEAV
jgi:hypothetical protein